MVKTESEIRKIRTACLKCKEILEELGLIIKAGITTYEIEEESEKLFKKAGVKPAFKNYNGYPASICTSVNEEVVHGIPSKDKILKEGDIVSIDIGVIYEGYYSDYASTFPVGTVLPFHLKLIEVAQKAFEKGLTKVYPGMKTEDIGSVIQKFVEGNGFSVVREFVGHGVGKNLHELPEVPNFGSPGKGAVLRKNEVIAIEPMVNAGSFEVKISEDGWKAVTIDGCYSAHYEECVLITENGPELFRP